MTLVRHTFVNPRFMSGVDVRPIKLAYDSEVKTPIGDQSLIATWVNRNYEMWVRECKLLIDLISLSIKGYDVILGVNF